MKKGRILQSIMEQLGICMQKLNLDTDFIRFPKIIKLIEANIEKDIADLWFDPHFSHSTAKT
jgi:hypothetical protein